MRVLAGVPGWRCDVEITARATGTLGGDTVSGTVQAHAGGNVDGARLHCTATYDLTGSRQQ